MFPITIANPAAKYDLTVISKIPVPCRKCPPCLAKRSNGWIFKLTQQDKVAQTAHFVTLTYSNEQFTKQNGRITPKGYLTLVKRDFQLFMKRLRKSEPYGNILKYFACGEYGSNTERPHFHAIIFNSSVERIENAWQLGICHIGTVTGNSIAYTTKYMHKGKTIPKHANDDRAPEFQLFSKGLGNNYVTETTIAYHNADINRNYLVVEGGVKVPMPDVYKKKIFSETVRKQQARRAQKLILEEEETRKQEYTAIYGSLDLYYKSQAESKRAAVNTFKQRQKERNKI